MAAPHQQWKSLYEFDTPVVRFVYVPWNHVADTSKIHFDKAKQGADFSTSAKAFKLMHRFKDTEIEQMMDKTMLNPPS